MERIKMKNPLLHHSQRVFELVYESINSIKIVAFRLRVEVPAVKPTN
jgi:hypothetical protein